MEDTRNKQTLHGIEFKEAYTKDLLARNDLSHVTRELIENSCIDVSYATFYWVKDAIQFFLNLDKYLKYNISNLNSYRYFTTYYLNGDKYSPTKDCENSWYYFNNIPAIKVCSFVSPNPYNFYTDGFPGEIHYLLPHSINLDDAIANNQGILSINISQYNRFQNTFIAKKHYVSNGLLYDEEYIFGGSNPEVRLFVYDVKKANQVFKEERDYEPPTLIYNPIPYLSSGNNSRHSDIKKIPDYIKKSSCCVLNLQVIKQEPEFIEVFTYDDKGSHNEKIKGDSVYEVYYNYMVKLNYFSNKVPSKNRLRIPE